MQELGLAPFPFSFIVSLMWVAIFMLVGIALRGLIPFCRKYLIPSCMVGGLVAFFFMNFLPLDWLDFMRPNTRDMEVFVFHLFNLSFVCFGLSGFGSNPANTPKSIVKGAAWLSFNNGVVNALQSYVAIGIILVYNIVMGTQLLESAGNIASQGFIAGPGAAMAMGAVFEQAGWANMISLGLAFSASGYLFSIILGVPAANFVMRKLGVVKAGHIPEDEQYGIYKPGKEESAGLLRFMSSNVDSMTFQICLILLTYGLAYGVVMLVRATGIFGPQGMGILWSFLAFLFCMPVGLIMRSILNRTPAGHLFDTGCHTRLLGIIIDLMALSALAGISMNVLKEWWVLFILLSIGMGLVSIIYLWYRCRYLTEYAGERFLVLVGTTLGTITTGLVLMRMLDPQFESPVPFEIGLNGMVGMIVSLPLMPFTQPLAYGQVFHRGGVEMPLIALTIGFVLYLVLLALPFWKMTDKVPKF